MSYHRRPPRRRASQKPLACGGGPSLWRLRLYVAGPTPRSLTAFGNLKRICERYLRGRYRIEVIDLAANPRRASHDQILSIPTLIRKAPPPARRLIGDLSDLERTVKALDLTGGESREGQSW
jgi:circadian clock protein KaiB